MDACPKADSAPPTLTIRGREFYRQTEGATCINNTVSCDSHLETGHQWSDQRHLDFFSTVNLRLQGRFVSISLRPVLGIVAVMSWLQFGHHVVTLLHLVGASVPAKQLTGYGSEYYL